jgi:DNA-binding response OmpR family regulator
MTGAAATPPASRRADIDALRVVALLFLIFYHLLLIYNSWDPWRVNSKSVHLTGKEYQMLELLSLRKGTTLTKEMFLNHLYGGMDEPELKIIDVFVCKLRKKLATATGGDNYIETVWGRGYVLRDPVSTDNAEPAKHAANA